MHQGSVFADRLQTARKADPGAASPLEGPALEQSTAFPQCPEQAPGEPPAPDAEFFVLCWTVGPTRAAEDLVERLRIQKEHAYQSASLRVSIPAISTEEFLRYRQMCASEAPSTQTAAEPFREAREIEDSGFSEIRDSGADGVRTLEDARRLLGVDTHATPAQIKSVYKELVRIYHPDRHEAASVQRRRAATARMAAINRAYSLLAGSWLTQAASSANPYR